MFSKERPGCLALPPRLRGGRGRPDLRPLNDSRMERSSASTMPAQRLRLVQRGRAERPCRQRKAVVGWTWQRSAAFATLVPSIIAWASSSHCSFLRSPAIGVFVRALNVRPQLCSGSAPDRSPVPRRRCRAPRNGATPAFHLRLADVPQHVLANPALLARVPLGKRRPARPPILEPPPRPVRQSPTQRPHRPPRPCGSAFTACRRCAGSTSRSRPANPQIAGLSTNASSKSDAPRWPTRSAKTCRRT